MRCQFAVTLMARRLSQSFGSTWLSGDNGPRIPALPTRTSRRWYRSLSASARRAMPSLSLTSSGTRVAELPAALILSSRSSSPPTVRPTAMMCAPACASSSAIAAPMPREAPVTSAIRSERGLELSAIQQSNPAGAGYPRLFNAAFRRRARPEQARSRPGLDSDGFGEQRQLSRAGVLGGLIGEGRRVVASEAVIGELRPRRVASLETHRAVDAVDRQEGEGIRADEFPHALEVVRGGEQLVALGRVDPVVIRMRDR